MIAQQRCRGFDAADAGQLQIHEDDVWPLLGKKCRSVFTAIGFTHDLEIVFKLQRGHKAATDDEVVVDKQKCDRHGGVGQVGKA